MPTITEQIVARVRLLARKAVKTAHGHARGGLNPQRALEALEEEAIADITKILNDAGVL